MRRKLTQRDLAVLYLSDLGGRVRVVTMRGVPFRGTFIGSEVDRRLQEVMEVVREQGYYEVQGHKYVIEEGSEGKFKTYRVVNPKPKVEFVTEWRDGRPWAVARPVAH